MKNTSKILALVLIVMTVLMSLSAITVGAAEAMHTFDCTTMTFVSDKGAVSGAYDDYFTFEGTVTMRGSDSKGVTSVELEKKSAGSITFTTAGPAKVTISFSSTGGSNNSFIVLVDSEGTALGEQVEVVGTTFIETVYEISAAGTYKVVNPGTGRTTRVKTVVVEDIKACEHNFVDGVCSLCGEADPNACQHTNKTAATCTTAEVCADCGKELSAALGHTAGDAPTCTVAQTCTVCGDKLVDALGHTLTFVNTVPTAEAAGKTIADCSVCNEHLDFGEVNVMTGGKYVLDAADLEGIAQYSLFDGEVKVVGGVFACHLSYKYRTDANEKTFTALAWSSTHRMNFGGASEFCDNGEGEEAVKNGGLKNYIQIVTAGETTITIAWGIGDAGREIAVYDMEGNLVAVTEEMGAKNDLAVSTLTVPAGAYLIGTDNTNAVKAGGNYIYKMEVEVVAPHVHDFADATCTEPSKCECGETQVDALGHSFAFGKCTRCGEEDPDWVEPPVDDGGDDEGGDNTGEAPVAPQNNLLAAIAAFFKKLLDFFKGLLGL